jgi:hypothetical protein
MSNKKLLSEIAYYIEQYPGIYSENKDKVLIFMSNRWKSTFIETARALKNNLKNNSLPNIIQVCETATISKSDQSKFIGDFIEVIRELSTGRTLFDDGEWVDTRCLIGIIENDVCKAIFCRGDGDLIHKGQILLHSYNEEKLKKLISLGDVWTLGKSIGIKHNFNDREPEYTSFHNRDMGIKSFFEPFRTYKNYSSLLRNADWSVQPIFFIMKNGIWYVGAPKKPYKNLIKKGEVLRLDEVLTNIKSNR